MSSRPSRGAARLAAILDALPDALLLVNANGTVVNANTIALETFETRGWALVGRGLLDLLPEFDSRLIPGSMRRPDLSDGRGQTKPRRMTARRTDGSEFPVEVTSANLEDGQDAHESHGYSGDELLMLVVRDLSGAVDTETELQRSQRQTEMILRAAAEGLVGTDTEGRIVLVNPAAAQILGHRAGDLGGKELHPLFQHSRPGGEPFPYEESALADTLRSGRKHRVRGQTLWAKDGSAVPVDLTTAPVRDGEQLVGAVLAFTDRRSYDKLVARHAAETEEAQRRYDALAEESQARYEALVEESKDRYAALAEREADRYETLAEQETARYEALSVRHAQLLAVLGDSLRGPLERLRGELGALAADPAGQLWPEANQVLHHLSAGYARMATLVDNVLAYQLLDSGVEKLQRATVRLDQVVSAGVDGAVELIGPGRAQFAVHAPPIEAEVDAVRLATALAHLIADVAGFDATGNTRAPASGATGGFLDSTVVVAAAQRGEVVRIEVRGPYAGGDPVHEPIVRGIVCAHGGVLQTHEVPGTPGSAYVLEVPIGSGAGSAVVPAGAPALPAAGETGQSAQAGQSAQDVQAEQPEGVQTGGGRRRRAHRSSVNSFLDNGAAADPDTPEAGQVQQAPQAQAGDPAVSGPAPTGRRRRRAAAEDGGGVDGAPAGGVDPGAGETGSGGTEQRAGGGAAVAGGTGRRRRRQPSGTGDGAATAQGPGGGQQAAAAHGSVVAAGEQAPGAGAGIPHGLGATVPPQGMAAPQPGESTGRRRNPAGALAALPSGEAGGMDGSEGPASSDTGSGPGAAETGGRPDGRRARRALAAARERAAQEEPGERTPFALPPAEADRTAGSPAHASELTGQVAQLPGSGQQPAGPGSGQGVPQAGSGQVGVAGQGAPGQGIPGQGAYAEQQYAGRRGAGQPGAEPQGARPGLPQRRPADGRQGGAPVGPVPAGADSGPMPGAPAPGNGPVPGGPAADGSPADGSLPTGGTPGPVPHPALQDPRVATGRTEAPHQPGAAPAPGNAPEPQIPHQAPDPRTRQHSGAAPLPQQHGPQPQGPQPHPGPYPGQQAGPDAPFVPAAFTDGTHGGADFPVAGPAAPDDPSRQTAAQHDHTPGGPDADHTPPQAHPVPRPTGRRRAAAPQEAGLPADGLPEVSPPAGDRAQQPLPGALPAALPPEQPVTGETDAPVDSPEERGRIAQPLPAEAGTDGRGIGTDGGGIGTDGGGIGTDGRGIGTDGREAAAADAGDPSNSTQGRAIRVRTLGQGVPFAQHLADQQRRPQAPPIPSAPQPLPGAHPTSGGQQTAPGGQQPTGQTPTNQPTGQTRTGGGQPTAGSGRRRRLGTPGEAERQNPAVQHPATGQDATGGYPEQTGHPVPGDGPTASGPAAAPAQPGTAAPGAPGPQGAQPPAPHSTSGHGFPGHGAVEAPANSPAAGPDPGVGRGQPRTPGLPVPGAPGPTHQTEGRAFAIGAPDAGSEGPEPLDGPNGAVEVANQPQPQRMDDELPPEPLDNPRRLLVWPAPDVSTQQALSDRGYRPVVVNSRDEVDAQIAAFPAALFVDPLTGPITRTALQSLRQAAVAAEVPVMVTAGLGQATREAAYGADPAVLLKALAPRDSEQHPPRVLLIEEHPEIALALTTSLERRGMQVAQAADDAEAVDLATRMHPNLVVMDLMQVRRRRAGIVDWLRANGRLNRTPLVIYTAAVDQSELPRLASGETVLFLAERSTSGEVQSRIVDLLAKIGTN